MSVSGFGAPQSKIFSAICGHYREKAAFGNESVSVLGQREMGGEALQLHGRVFERRKKKYRDEKKSLQNIFKQDPGKAGQSI